MITLVYLLQAAVAALWLSAAACLIVRPRAAKYLRLAVPETSFGRASAGALALLPAIFLLVSVAAPFFAFFAAIFSVLTSLGFAIFAFLRRAAVVQPLLAATLVAGSFIAALQPLGLKVMMLPHADDLPYEPIPAEVVKTYGEGVWLEGVGMGPDGVLYLAANLGIDFTRPDYYRRAHGEVIARSPDGAERVLFTTPVGSTAGVPAIGSDGAVYISSNGYEPGIWKIARDGRGEKLTTLPSGAWPNGLAFGPDGMLYAPDSNLGLVWRIDPASGQAERAVRDKALAARPFVALAPGANGLHFRGREMIVTVSDSAKVLRFLMADDGRFSGPEELAKGVPGDDFAIGRDGSLFITTHPYNTLVKVAPDGKRSVVADSRQRIIGATDAVFGVTEADRDTLYVVTDGGAFTGGPKARGELIALKAR